MNNSVSDTDSEDEVFFGPIKPRESPLVERLAKRKTVFYTPDFRKSANQTFLYFDENFDIAAEEYVETCREIQLAEKTLYVDEQIEIAAEEEVAETANFSEEGLPKTLFKDVKNCLNFDFGDEESNSENVAVACCLETPIVGLNLLDSTENSKKAVEIILTERVVSGTPLEEVQNHSKVVDKKVEIKEALQAKNVEFVVSNKFVSKKKERRLSRSFNEFNKGNIRVSPADNRKVYVNKNKIAKSPPRKERSTLKIKPKILSKTPETLLKSTLKKNHRKAVSKLIGIRQRNISSTSSTDEIEEDLKVKPTKNGREDDKNDEIWTNLSSSEDNSSSQSSDDGEMCPDLKFAIAQLVDKYTPEKLSFHSHNYRKIFS